MRIDNVFAGQAVNLSGVSEAADILSRLNIGDVIRAQILEITSGELFLKLFDGSTLKASAMSPIEAKAGELAEFIVKNKNENQLVLETFKNNKSKISEPGSELKKQLNLLEIKPDAKNLEIAMEMKNNNIPFNIENFNKIVELLLKFKDLSPSKAAFITGNNIKADESNIQKLNELVSGKLKIASDIEDITILLDKIEYPAVLERLSKRLTEYEASRQGKTGLENSSSQTGLPAKESKPAALPDLKSFMEIALKDLKPVISNKIEILLQNPKFTDEILKLASSGKISTGEMEETINSLLKSTLEDFEMLPVSQRRDLGEAISKALRELAAKAGTDGENTAKVQQTDDTGNGVEKAKAEIKKAFEDIFAKTNSENLAKDLNPKETFRNILQKLDIVKEEIASVAFTGRDDINSKIENVQSNIKFINELNNNNTYIQIPLTVLNKHTNGELFVLKRDSRKRKLDPGNVTMYLSLNTEHIGQVDSLISVNKKSISVNMRVENDKLFEVIKENHKHLYNSLSEKGYKLVDLKYRLIENKANIINIEDIVKKEQKVGRTSIDCRL